MFDFFDKEMFDNSAKSKYYDDSNKLVVSKIENGTSRVAIEELVGIRPRTYLLLVYENSEHKKE